MSLFGESPPASPSRERSSRTAMFGAEESPDSSKLFAEAESNSSLWARPDKSTIRLDADEVPASYQDLYVLLSADGSVSIARVQEWMKKQTIREEPRAHILRLAGVNNDESINEQKFYILVALVGFAQQNETLSLKAIEQQRKRGYRACPRLSLTQDLPEIKQTVQSSNGPASDPWAAPSKNSAPEAPTRTTSAFTTESADTTFGGTDEGWAATTPTFNAAFASSQRTGEETVSVTLLPDKQGAFLFQHHNYEIKSVRRGSCVTRRYSDFAWLLDCLHKRYPFRQLPLLPPKRVSGE